MVSARTLIAVFSLALVAGLAVYGNLVSHGIPGRDGSPYDLRNKPAPTAAPEFAFTDASTLLGPRKNFARTSVGDASYVAVADYDHDGFEDIAWLYSSVYPEVGARIVLLKNERGKSFTDATASSGLAEIVNGDMLKGISAIAFADFDNDGWPDLYVARSYYPHYALRNAKGKFQLWKNFFPKLLAGLNTRGINLLDYDHDGYVDVLLTNFIDFKALKDQYPGSFGTSDPGAGFSCTIGCEEGQPKTLLHNEAGQALTVSPASSSLGNRGATWASGVGDFTRSGRQDIFLANDFGYDAFYRNVDGNQYQESTLASLGKLRSRFSMSAEVGDVDNSGELDIYVSNASKPGFTRGLNSLWMNDTKGPVAHFVDEGFRRGVDKCGWSWGAKFVDFDKDGWLDLFVANGYIGHGDGSHWYHSMWGNRVAPYALRRWIGDSYGLFHSQHDFAGGQKNCVFVRKGEKFLDVADQVGVGDELNGRGVALLDFDNDGQEDILIGNLGTSPLLYHGQRSNGNHWLGISLVGVSSNRDAIGAKIRLTTSRGSQTRVIYPGNGFASQSTKRVLFGIPDGDSPKQLEIRWPSGIVQHVDAIPIDSYLNLTEKKDKQN